MPDRHDPEMLMSPAAWVRATNAVTALTQCGDALARAVSDAITALTMADAVLTRTRAWLAEAEPPAADADAEPWAKEAKP